MSEQVALPELRLMHELGEREIHMMRKIQDLDPYSTAYYRCKCGAEADRYGQILPEEAGLF